MGKALNTAFRRKAVEMNVMTAKLKRAPATSVVVGLTALLMMVLFVACAGEQGPLGPQGAQGAPGPVGPPGPAAPLRAGAQAASVADLKEAEGVVFDWVRAPVDQPRETDWIVSGRWTLDCNGECVDADLDNIQFGMAFSMVQPGGAQSHSHQFTKFSATSVEHVVRSDELKIKGTITVSNFRNERPEIMIELVDIANGNATFFFTMGPNNPLQGQRTGGAIIESG